MLIKKLVPVRRKVVPQDLSQVALCAAVSGTVIVRKIKMRDTVIKSGAAHCLHVVIMSGVPKIVPETERNHWKLFKPLAPQRLYCMVS